MISKLIHIINLNNHLTQYEYSTYYKSWKEHLPDYEIVEWNEGNCDIQDSPYVKLMYNNGYYVYASDYIRCKVLYKYGGIYLDTDFLLTVSIDFCSDFELTLHEQAFRGEYMSFVISSCQGNTTLKHYMDKMDKIASESVLTQADIKMLFNSYLTIKDTSKCYFYSDEEISPNSSSVGTLGTHLNLNRLPDENNRVDYNIDMELSEISSIQIRDLSTGKSLIPQVEYVNGIRPSLLIKPLPKSNIRLWNLGVCRNLPKALTRLNIVEITEIAPSTEVIITINHCGSV